MASNRSYGLNTHNYVWWDAQAVEKVSPNEKEDIQAVAGMINTTQKTHYNTIRHMFSGTHPRTQGLLKGKLILADLPPYLTQTKFFSKPGEFPIAIRYSTETADPSIDDRIPQPRGLGMKVFNVQGEMSDAGKEFPTQDIEFNSTPAIELADTKTTKEIFQIRLKYGGDKKELYKHHEARDDTDLQKARDEVLNTHLETAYRFGDYVVKYSLVPSSETQKKLYEEQVNPNSHTNHVLSDWLKEFYSKNDAEYLFQVQFCENLEDQPVEYPGKE